MAASGDHGILAFLGGGVIGGSPAGEDAGRAPSGLQ
jgi:hypothetical protein